MFLKDIKMPESLEALARESEKALVFGIGGGGDIVGALPTYRYLKFLGLESIVGGLSWERSINDPKPGPRKIEEIKDIKLLSDTTALATPRTRTEDGVKFAETSVAEIIGEDTFLLDPSQGVQGMIRGLNSTVEKLDIDLIVGIDVGGDVMAKGDEDGLQSMLADSMVLASLTQLDIPTVLGVLGCGADGELGQEKFLENSAEVARLNGFLGARGIAPEDMELLSEAVRNTKTESSALAVETARGQVGEIEIRDGRRRVNLSLVSAITFYFDPKIVMEGISMVAKRLIPTQSLRVADKILREEKIPTEVDFERDYEAEDQIKEGR